MVIKIESALDILAMADSDEHPDFVSLVEVNGVEIIQQGAFLFVVDQNRPEDSVRVPLAS